MSEYKRKRQRKGTTTTRSTIGRREGERKEEKKSKKEEKDEKEERKGDKDGRRGVRVWRQQEVLDSSTQVRS